MPNGDDDPLPAGERVGCRDPIGNLARWGCIVLVLLVVIALLGNLLRG